MQFALTPAQLFIANVLAVYTLLELILEDVLRPSDHCKRH
jgi:hypothetical protein